MKIEIVRSISFDELVQKIRDVPLMKPREDGSQIYVYKDADISLQQLRSEQVNPPTFYLLKKQMEVQRDLRRLLAEQGIDSLNLDRALEIKNDSGKIWTLTPPIIEVTPRTVKYNQQQGEIDYSQRSSNINIPLICDGAHRVALARELNTSFTAVYISGVDENFPYYAHPNGWDMVNVVEEVPKTKEEKKFYRFLDCYALYRDFGVVGCGKPRHTS